MEYPNTTAFQRYFFMHFIFLLMLSICVSGCGGGSGSSNNSIVTQQNSVTTTTVSANAIPDQIGTFRDSPVTNLRYIASSPDSSSKYEGLTNEKGEFKYYEGGSIQFYFGSSKIGENTLSKSIISSSDLASSEVSRVNIARFLMSLDTDGNSQNGIQLPAAPPPWQEIKRLILRTPILNQNTQLLNRVLQISLLRWYQPRSLQLTSVTLIA